MDENSQKNSTKNKEIIDRFTRPRWLFGDNFEKLSKAKGLICGCGGVGGACIDALYRSGVTNLTIIDCDKFEITNQNRQIGSEFLGEYKTEVLARIYSKIFPINQKITAEFLAKFNLGEFNFIVDAIDDMSAKVALAHAVFNQNLTNSPLFVSSMGGAKRLDPSKISLTNIWKTNTDALAKKFRYELRKSGFTGDFDVVFSSEEPRCDKLGSCKVVTASFGLFLASYVLRHLTKIS